MLWPLHRAVVPLIVKVGVGVTVTVATAEAVQVPLVPVSV